MANAPDNKVVNPAPQPSSHGGIGTSSSATRSAIWRRPGVLWFVVATFASAATFPLSRYIGLGPAPGPYAYWPVIGVLCGIFYRRPYAEWPLISVASVVAHTASVSIIRGDLAGGASIFGAALGVLQALLAALLMLRVGTRDTPLENSKNLAWFIIGGVILVPMIITPFSAYGFANGLHQSFMSSWRPLFAGDSLSILLFAPLFMRSWRPADDRIAANRPQRAFEISFCQFLTALAAILIFGKDNRAVIGLQPAVIFPLLGWAALRCGPRWTSIGVVVVATIGAWLTARGHGPFGLAALSINDRILDFQLYIAISAFTALLLSALTEQRRRAFRDLAIQHAVQRAFFDSSGAMMWLKDLRGTYVLMNRAAKESLPPGVDSVDGEPLDDRDRRVLERGAPITFDETVTIRGRKQHLERTYFPVADDQGVIHYIGLVGRDNTIERALADRLQRAQQVELLGQLAAGLAHDLNNVLSVVRGNAELLCSSASLREDDALMLADILEASHRGTAFTRRMLSLGRSQATLPSDLNVDAAIRTLEPMLNALARGNVDLHIALQAEGSVVRMNPLNFEQIMLNLVSNARDAVAGSGQIYLTTARIGRDEISPEARAASPASLWARIEVRDSGPGMDEEALANLFEAFFSTKGERGTGLGLFTTASFVREGGGVVRAESERGVGAALIIELPVVDNSSREK